jgi:hypothetical protein
LLRIRDTVVTDTPDRSATSRRVALFGRTRVHLRARTYALPTIVLTPSRATGYNA